MKLKEGGVTLDSLRNMLRQGANLTLDNPGEQGVWVYMCVYVCVCNMHVHACMVCTLYMCVYVYTRI